jgi:hypothetical protein
MNRPATPPPEFHLEKAIASIRRLRELDASDLYLTHFGSAGDGEKVKGVPETCDEAVEALNQWASWVRAAREETNDLDAAAELVGKSSRSALQDSLSEDQIDRLENTTSYWMNTWGFMRYMDGAEGS